MERNNETVIGKIKLVKWHARPLPHKAEPLPWSRFRGMARLGEPRATPVLSGAWLRKALGFKS